MRNFAVLSLTLISVLQTGVSLSLDNEGLKTLLVKGITEGYIGRLQKNLQSQGLLGKVDPKAPVFPTLPDPLPIQQNSIDLDIVIPIGSGEVRIIGGVGLTSETNIVGFSQIEDDLSSLYNPLTSRIRVTWDLKLPQLSLEGNHAVNLSIDVFGANVNVLGGGRLSGGIEGSFFLIDSVVRAPLIGKMSAHSFVLDFGFENVQIDGGEVYVGEQVTPIPVDWERLSEALEAALRGGWTDERKARLSEVIRCQIDHVVNDCNVLALIGGDAACLKTEINQECLQLESSK